MFKEVVVNRFGGPECLEIRQLDSQPLSPGELRLEVRAIGVNRADLMARSGNYHLKHLPMIPGLEASGWVIESKGSISIGTPVLIYRKQIGLYAEEVVVSEHDVFVLPSGFDLKVAASIPVNWLTAHHCLMRLLKVQSGEKLLITAASSAVGNAAIQIALAMGVHVFASVGSDSKKHDLQLKFPSIQVEVLDSGSILNWIKKETNQQGVDVALDLVGGAFFREVIHSVSDGGRIAQAANVTLQDSVINVRDFYARNISVFGFQYGNLMKIKKDHFEQDLGNIIRNFQEGHYQSNISAEFLLEHAAQAHEALMQRSHMGKVILVTEKSVH
jgi:NADPH2:quinone reductase